MAKNNSNTLGNIATFAGNPGQSLRKLVARPWALLPDVLDATIAAVSGLLKETKGGDYTEEMRNAIGQKTNSPFQNTMRTTIENGIAVIPVRGILMPDPDIWEMWFMGASSMRWIESEFLKAVENSEVTGIVLYVASPGGDVQGTQRLARVIYEHRSAKPIVAFTATNMSSAAYWIASAAHKIVAEADAYVGSIGIFIRHMDISKFDEGIGLKVTHITAGKDKVLGNAHEPLGSDGKAYLQEFVNDAMKHFTAAVKAYRGEKINIGEVANGRAFTASVAQKNGLVDKIGVIEDAINLSKKGVKVTLETLKAEHADLVTALRGEFITEIAKTHITIVASDALIATARTEEKANADTLATQRVTEEKDRSQGIKGVAMPGQETMAEKMITDGKSVAEATTELLADAKQKAADGTPYGVAQTPEEKAKAKILAEQQAAAPEAVEQPAAQVEGKGKTLSEQLDAITDPTAAAEFQKAHAADLDKEARASFGK